MKKLLFSVPDQFAMAPLLCLLPSLASADRLLVFEAPLFARLEKVQRLQDELKPENDQTVWRRLSAEAEMLKQVLDWLGQRKGSEA